MPAIAAGFAFTYQDRRRLKAAMRPVRDARHYRRLEAVWLVAEGHSVGATANLLNASRRSRHQGAGPLPSASPPGGSGRRQTLGPTARGARAFPRTPNRVAADRSDELGLCGRGLDGPAAERPRASVRRGRRTVRAHDAGAPARRGLGLETAAVRLQPERAAPRPEKGALTRRLKRMPSRAVLLAEDETTLRFLPPLRAAWAPRGQQAHVPISGHNAQRTLFGALNVRNGRRVLLCVGR